MTTERDIYTLVVRPGMSGHRQAGGEDLRDPTLDHGTVPIQPHERVYRCRDHLGVGRQVVIATDCTQPAIATLATGIARLKTQPEKRTASRVPERESDTAADGNPSTFADDYSWYKDGEIDSFVLDTRVFDTHENEGMHRSRKDDRYRFYVRDLPHRNLKTVQFISRRPEYRGDYGDSTKVRAYYEEMLTIGFTPDIVAQAFVDDPTCLVARHYLRIREVEKELIELLCVTE